MIGFHPRGMICWDFWTILDPEGLYHAFYLQAPRDLPDPVLCHEVAKVGHAVSEDLISWKELGVVLEAGPCGSWDDRCIWTGSVVKHGSDYCMLYTSRSNAEAARVQRIGLAISSDLYAWQKYPGNPVLEVDPRWYENQLDSPDGKESCRDPFVWRDAVTNQYYTFFTARTRWGEPSGRGCVGLATSSDLLSWQVLPPVYSPGLYYEMEVPQVTTIGERHYLLFSVGAYSARFLGERPASHAQVGTRYALSSHLLGGYTEPPSNLLVGGARCPGYSAKLIQSAQGDAFLLYFQHEVSRTGRPTPGVLSPAKRVAVDSSGALTATYNPSLEKYTVPMAWPVVTEEDLGSLGDGGTWDLSDSTRVSGRSAQRSIRMLTPASQSIMVRVDVTIEEGNCAGVAIVTDTRQMRGHTVVLSARGQSASVRTLPWGVVVETRPLMIAYGRSHELKILTHLNVLEVYVNGSLLLSTALDEPLPASWGLAVENSKARFASLSVRRFTD